MVLGFSLGQKFGVMRKDLASLLYSAWDQPLVLSGTFMLK